MESQETLTETTPTTAVTSGVPVHQPPHLTKRLDTESLPTAIEEAICNACRWFLERELPVELEGLGLLLPVRAPNTAREEYADVLRVRHEEKISIRFEKCSEITAFHRQRYPGLVGARGLAERAFVLLSPDLSQSWQPTQIEHAVRGFCRKTKREAVTDGLSLRLGSIGKLYAVHNRQGSGFADWFAGADLFLAQPLSWVDRAEQWLTCEIPLVDSPAEVLEALGAKRTSSRMLDLRAQLETLGYEFDPADEESRRFTGNIKVDLFLLQEEGRQDQFVLTSDGLRLAGIRSGGSGNELVVQCPAIGEEAPEWAYQVLALGWMLLLCRKSRALKTGAAVSVQLPHRERGRESFEGVVTTTFQRCSQQLRSAEGPFRLINLVVIHSDEVRLAQEHSGSLLLDVLGARGLHQLSRPGRSSVLNCSALIAPSKSVH